MTDTFKTTALSEQFADQNAPKKPKRRKRPAPVAIRVSDEERAALEKARGDQSMNAFLRSQLLAPETGVKLRQPRKSMVEDYELLARVLAALGRSGIPDALDRLVAAQEGRSGLLGGSRSAKVDFALQQACADVAAMRRDLVTALGLKPR